MAVTAGIDFGFALFFTAFLNLTTGWSAAPHSHVIYVYAGILILHGLLNTFGVRVVAFLSNVSVWWHVIGVLIIAGCLAFIPSHHASASFVFTHFVNETGFHWPWYVFLIGLLMAQYTFAGYDASAHMSEETVGAAMKAPRGIVNSIVVSLVAGLVLLVAITWAITDYQGAITSPTGVPPAQIFIDAVGRRGGELLLLIAIVAQAYCGMASVTANSRMIYAFSRDGAVPGHRIWSRINPRTRTPTNSIWFAVVGAFLLGLPFLANQAAYAAVTSIATIGLYIAYVTPTLLRRLRGDAFEPGPWQLGRWSPVVGWIGIVWVGIITVLFVLPTLNPITWDTFNYAPVAVGVVILSAGGWWLISARKWYRGPVSQGDEAALRAMEAELDAEAEGLSPAPAGATLAGGEGGGDG